MLSARYRRAVAQALAALQQAAEASAPVIDLCGSQEADAAADIEGADPDDEVGEHFSADRWARGSARTRRTSSPTGGTGTNASSAR